MSPEEWTVRVEDILSAIGKIRRYTAEMDKEEFDIDEMVQDAVVRNFTVIGEAAGRVPEEVRLHYPDIPWARMRGMRNLVVHGYSDVDLEVVWATIWNDLPPLVPKLEETLERER